MKEEKSEKQLQTVEPKKSFFKSLPKAEEKKAMTMIAKKDLKVSKPKESWSVKAGDDVSNLSADKIAILKLNGAI